MPNVHMDKDNPLKGKKTGKWSKYGGAVGGLEKEAIQGVWYCQACGSEQPESLKPFMFELSEGEFLRMCAVCIHSGEITIRRVIRIRVANL